MREKAGHYCTVPVFISGSRYAVSPASRIESDMKKFVKWFNDNEHKLPTPEFAALAHQKFVFFMRIFWKYLIFWRWLIFQIFR